MEISHFSIRKHNCFLLMRDLVIAVYRARRKWNSLGTASPVEVTFLPAFIKTMNLQKKLLQFAGGIANLKI